MEIHKLFWRKKSMTVPLIFRCQFLYAAQHRVCTWNTRQSWGRFY